MYRTVLLFFVLVLALGSFGGCATMENAGRNQKLQLQLSSYDHTVRWGDLNEMYGYVKPGETPLRIPEGLDNIRVTEYEEVGPRTEAGSDRIRRRVKIQYLHRDRQVVRTLIDEQVWEYDPELEQWFRVNPPPEF